MQWSQSSAISSLFASLRCSLSEILELDPSGSTYPPSTARFFLQRRLLLAVVWSLGGGLRLADRIAFAKAVSLLAPQLTADLTGSSY